MISWLLLSASLFFGNPSDELKLNAHHIKRCFEVEDALQCDERPTIVDIYVNEQFLVFVVNEERLEYRITEINATATGTQYRIVDFSGDEIFALVETSKVSLLKSINSPAYLTYY